MYIQADKNIAKVTLTSLNGGLGPVQRRFVLNASCQSISVGRASKTASKGLLAAADNAWFDSPVMSRKHAVMSFDPLKEVGLAIDNEYGC